MGSEKPLRVPWRLKPPHQFFSLSRRPVGTFDTIVKALVRSIVMVTLIMIRATDFSLYFQLRLVTLIVIW